jgi:hypothetical protein
MKKIGLLFVSCLLIVGCGNALTEREKAELGGAQLISQAREAFVTANYTTAVALIDSIRNAFPLALNAREEGILLKDSVLLEQAREELRNAKDIAGDSIDLEELHMKVNFYERKLQHDLEQKQTH